MNLLVAFAVSLKHKLRFEPYTDHPDIEQLIAHLDTFAQEATLDSEHHGSYPAKSMALKIGDYLGLTYTTSNPRQSIKRATRPLGNLPLEIITYLSAYIDDLVDTEQIHLSSHHSWASGALSGLNEVLVNTDRVANTPVPIAYSIAIAQITWLFVILLPFQLVGHLGWLTIPMPIAAAYVVLAILYIGHEVENPFGHDVNDLPLDLFCEQIAKDLEILTSKKRPNVSDFVRTDKN